MTRKFVFIITLASLFNLPTIFAQQTMLYDSIVNIADDSYLGKFEYYIDKNDTIFNGRFSLTQQVEEISNDNSFSISLINGEFKDNTPIKDWVIRRGEFTPTERGAFIDYSYSFKINGEEMLTKGTFQDGIKNSSWMMYEWEITNSTIQDTLLFGEIPYVNDTVNGDFSFYNRGQYLSGNFTNNFANGRWLFYTKNSRGKKVLTKEWIFRDNILVKKILHQGDKKQELIVIDPENVEKTIEEIEISERYFTIIDLKTSLDDHDLHLKYKQSEIGKDLFFKIINDFKSVDSIFYPISQNKISPVIKAKIQKYPYSDEEKKSLKNIQDSSEKAHRLIKILKEDVQINLAKLSNSQVAFYISTVEALEKKILADILFIVHHFKESNLEFINRDLFIEANTKIDKNLDVKQIFNNDSSTINYQLYNFNVDQEANQVSQLEVFTYDVLEELNQIKDSVETYVQEIKAEENLSEIESVLFNKYEELKNLTDSLVSDQNNNIAEFDVKNVVKDYLDETVKKYSGLENTQAKNEAIKETLACLNYAEELIHTLEKAPENYYTVRDSYTREVFNPYTYTNMQEKIKPSIYKSFEEDILPAVYENLKRMDCNNIVNFNNNFSILFEGMIKLLKEDTDKLDRKVKRARDVKKAADLLGFQLNF